MTKPKRSWSRRAIAGSAALAIVGVAVVVGFVGYRILLRTLEEQSADPASRNARAMRLLGAGELPADYQATGSLSLPLIGDVVVLEDGPARFSVGAGHAFLYLETRRSDRRLPFGPSSDDPFEPLLELRGFEVSRGTPLASGELEVGRQQVTYEAFRGHLERLPRGAGHVLVALIEIECEEFKRRRRVALWMGPDPAPGEPAESLPLAGTTADPEHIRSMLEGFELCRD